MDDEATAYQRLMALNDPSGNPQRLYILYSFDGDYWSTIGLWDEGYRDRPETLRDVPELPQVSISRSDYHDYIRRAKVAGYMKES